MTLQDGCVEIEAVDIAQVQQIVTGRQLQVVGAAAHPARAGRREIHH